MGKEREPVRLSGQRISHAKKKKDKHRIKVQQALKGLFEWFSLWGGDIGSRCNVI